MKKLIFSSGEYRVDTPGATIVVIKNLFYKKPNHLLGAIIGPGKFIDSETKDGFYQINTINEYMRKTSLLRKLLRFKRFNNVNNPNSLLVNLIQKAEIRISYIADSIAAQQLEVLLRNNIEIDVVVGFTGLSLKLGLLAKKYGLKYGLHSQFCHPKFQNHQLKNAYQNLKIKPPKISERKLENQLATIELADFIWCPSEFAQKSHISNAINRKKTFVNYLGIEVEKFQPFEKRTIKDKIFTILFVGNVGIQKGIHILLKAVELSNINEMELIFNGGSDSPADVIIENYRNRFSKKKITISVDPGDPRRYFSKASIFILPSVHDSFGISVIEAMAAGLPVIVSDHVGAKEIVMNGSNGFVFSSGDSVELAEKIEYFYTNPEKIIEFGFKSAEYAISFDIAKKGFELESKIKQNIN